MQAVDFAERLLRRGASPVTRRVLAARPAARFVAGGEANGEALQVEGQLGEPADLGDGNGTAARVGGELEPTAGFVNDAIRELKFRFPERFEAGAGGGGGVADDASHGVLGGVGEACLERGHAAGPVELGGETAERRQGTAGLRRGAMGATAFEAQISGEGDEVGGGFAGLTLSGARRAGGRDHGEKAEMLKVEMGNGTTWRRSAESPPQPKSEQMPHLLLLRFQIAFVVRVRFHFDR